MLCEDGEICCFDLKDGFECDFDVVNWCLYGVLFCLDGRIVVCVGYLFIRGYLWFLVWFGLDCEWMYDWWGCCICMDWWMFWRY